MYKKRKLEEEQERTVALQYLCGVNLEYLTRKWGVSESTIRINIMKKYSPLWRDPLVEFYRKTHPRNHARNGAHIYLAFNGRDVPQKTLVNANRDKAVYEAVETDTYQPRMNEVIVYTILDRIIVPSDGFEELMCDLFGPLSPVELTKPLLLDRLQKAHHDEEKVSLDDVYSNVRKDMIRKIKRGGLGITDYKAQLILDAVATLTEKEADTIKLSYGLVDGRRLEHKELIKYFGLTGQKICQLKAEAFRKLRHPSRSQALKILRKPATDADISNELEFYRNLLSLNRPRGI